ncbi:MAG: hypothetical protein ACRDP8_22285, partial [Actinopolymorphaceae bacterium]
MSEPVSEAAAQPRGRRRGRGRKVAGVVAAFAVTGAAVVATAGVAGRGWGFGADGFGSLLDSGAASAGGGDATAKAAATLPPATVSVTKQTLQSTETVDGDLGFGPSSTLTNRLQGTVTALPDSGQEIKRGRSLYKVDDQPVVLMYGALP